MSHIMIVDDQPFVLEFLSQDLAGDGHRITCVKKSDELMENIRKAKPDIILLDLFLNGFEGWDLLREIKRDQPTLPVLILSAYDSFRDDPRTELADGYIVKDVRTDRLLGEINHILNDKKMDSGKMGS